MSSTVIIILIAAYFLLLLFIAKITSKNADEASFFIGNKSSKWYVVAFGMIGASLSGVTFISVPGWVGSSAMTYFQVVLGYLLGYVFISFILMPLYYRLNLTSIYTFLGKNLGKPGNQAGASFFLFSRILGAAFRLYLVCLVLKSFVLVDFNIPFPVIALISIALIWLYTNKGGIKTIIWTDTLQTAFMLVAIALAFWQLSSAMNFGVFEAVGAIFESDYSNAFVFDDINSKQNFWKQFLGGALITITMTGMDQDMMQKNLSCKNIGDAQKNMLSFAGVLVFVNLLFLGFGALMFMYIDAGNFGADQWSKSDEIFPALALSGNLGMAVAIFFILGLIAAAYSSADSALTSLTTSLYVDFLEDKKDTPVQAKKKRRVIHVGISVALFLVIVIFEKLADSSVIDQLLTVAGYTYGPILGMFIFCLTSQKNLANKPWAIWVAAIAAPFLTYAIKAGLETSAPNYQIGYELLLLNGLINYGLLMLFGVNSPRLQTQNKPPATTIG
ncbi:sodium:solute symporter [Luteibaculum oceani]|uniref:Sodium:solute symporter n=1 Tax=Luteibaculum oceani TaxID=1294296 RepID=A0A5C6VC05_9FLAO|nr:sodium:solute symporter [Luteibaculum oceani]TXC82066.1 sodium:solute symporter [Luteibaculum oceani]